MKLWKELQQRRAAMAEHVRNNGCTAEAVAQAARQWDCSTNTIRNACFENGVEIIQRPRGRSARSFEILAALLYTDKSLAQIGRDVDRATSWVHQVLAEARRAGIRVREKEPAP